jgi:UDP-glucose 4-epimerase
MRVVIFGATGNVGTSVLEALSGESQVEEVVAVARRAPSASFPRTTFIKADVTSSDLVPIVRGAQAVIHLAWLIQPGRDEGRTHSVNVTGSQRVMEAVVEAGVRSLIYASSIGAYSPGPKDRLVDESWATEGVSTSFYSRHKVAVERLLDRLEREAAGIRVVRLRPALIFKRRAATEIRRLFAGPLLPSTLIRPGLIPFVPALARLRFQVVHSLDVGDAYRRALLAEVRGPFNVAAEPPIGPDELADILHARPLRIPAGALRAAAAATYKLRLQPTEPGWLDMGLAVPLIDSSRARSELGWSPRHSGIETLQELLDGLRRGADDQTTPPLARSTSGPLRIREMLTGVGGRQGL